MKEVLNKLIDQKPLDQGEAKEILTQLAQGAYNNSQVAAFLTVYLMRPITLAELTGFRDAMLDLCLPLDIEGYEAIDLCGTGGDGKDTFNISTLASFVVAGAGQNVAKHGNNAVSSASGSSNVLAHFGHSFSNEPEVLKANLDESNLCFLHAPLFHPAMKNVAPIRKELGVKTFFNMLGPMVNPSFPQRQMVGVFSLELARLYAYLYQQSDKRFAIVHSLDGYDEISLTGPFKVIDNAGEHLYQPEDLGLSKLNAEQLYGGATVAEAAEIFLKVLEGKGSKAQNEVVLANAGLALSCAQPGLKLKDAVQEARVSLEQGKALRVFQTIMKKG